MSIRNPQAEIDHSGPNSGSSLAVRLWQSYLSKYWGKLALAVVGMGAYAASASFIPAGVEWINSALAGQNGPSGLDAGRVVIWGPLLILGLGAINAGSQYLQSRLSASAALHALKDIQNDVAAKTMRIDDRQLRALGSGQVISRLTNDVTVLRETLSRATTAIRDLMTLAGLCAVMIYYDWILFLIVLVVYPVIGWPVATIGKYLRTQSRLAQGQSGDIASLGGELVSGGRLIRAYGLEASMTEQSARLFEDRRRVLMKMANLRALNEPFVFFVGSVALAIVVAVVAMRVEAGALSVTEFISFIIALLLMSQPARGLSTLNAVAQEGFGAFDRLLEVIDLEPTIHDAPGALPIRMEGGRIEFEDVRFAYSEATNALDGLSLVVPAGKTVALVGESGGGKSTIFALLQRLYDADHGEILIDGQAIGDVTLLSLRNAMSIVSQETMIFDASALENIAYGKFGATRDEIIEAARSASAHEFIQALPQGYDTRLGEGGNALSGGQRQRIAIARAFLRDAPILLFDEATSALDSQTEAEIQSALLRLTHNRTTIIIAHRLATVRHADEIFVIEKGKAVEAGSHDALIEKSGPYKSLVEAQHVLSR